MWRENSSVCAQNGQYLQIFSKHILLTELIILQVFARPIKDIHSTFLPKSINSHFQPPLHRAVTVHLIIGEELNTGRHLAKRMRGNIAAEK